jgi:hypothetical protein
VISPRSFGSQNAQLALTLETNTDSSQNTQGK